MFKADLKDVAHLKWRLVTGNYIHILTVSEVTPDSSPVFRGYVQRYFEHMLNDKSDEIILIIDEI